MIDLFRGNFCPLHSYLLDRHRIDSDDLVFDSALTWEEDYDFLLRICAKYSSDFSPIKTQIGEYYYKTDGSNSAGFVMPSEPKRSIYEMVSAMIEARRHITMVSPRVQQDNGISPPEKMTIREFIDRLVES